MAARIGNACLPTQLRRSPIAPARSLSGHQERFPPPRLSGRCGFESDPLLPTISAPHQTVGKRLASDHCTLVCFRAPARRLTARLQAKETTSMTIDVATGIVRILKEEGVGWVSTFPVCRVNNALGREGVPMLMMRDDRYAVAVADAFSRISAGSRIGVCTFQGGVNAAGMQYAYAGMAQAFEDGSPVLCITDGVPAGSSGNSQYDVASAMKTVSKWFGYLDKPERTPELMRRAFTMLRSGRPGPVILAIPNATATY